MSQDFATLSARGSAPWVDKVLDGNSSAQEVAKRLRIAIDRIGGNKGVMAKIGIPSRTLSEFLAGGEMKRGAVIALADACGVNIAWLAAGRGPMLASEEAAPAAAPSQATRPAESRVFSAMVTMDADVMGEAIAEATRDFTEANKSPSSTQLATYVLALYDRKSGQLTKP